MVLKKQMKKEIIINLLLHTEHTYISLYMFDMLIHHELYNILYFY